MIDQERRAHVCLEKRRWLLRAPPVTFITIFYRSVRCIASFEDEVRAVEGRGTFHLSRSFLSLPRLRGARIPPSALVLHLKITQHRDGTSTMRDLRQQDVQNLRQLQVRLSLLKGMPEDRTYLSFECSDLETEKVSP